MSTDDPNAPFDDGETALHRAAREYDQGAAVRALIARGADPRRTDRLGRCPIWAALQGQADAVIPMLVAAGADPNARDTAGRLPLAEVTRWRNAHVARALVAAGADPMRPEADGSTALTLALDRGDRAVLAALLGDETRADAALAARPNASAIADARAAVLVALREGRTYYRVNKEGWTDLAFAPDKNVFVERSDGDSGPYEATIGDDEAALAYIYDREAWTHTREFDLWNSLVHLFRLRNAAPR